MAGTIEGGLKARDKNLENDPDFYRKIGALGGAKSGKGGFWYKKHVLGDIESIRAAGRKGGKARTGKTYVQTRGKTTEENVDNAPDTRSGNWISRRLRSL